MKLRYFSDLHLEFMKPNKIQKFIKKIPIGTDEEICILAGDIGNPYKYNYDVFMKFISQNFKKTFVIAGNHEYYNKTQTIDETNVFLSNYFTQFNTICFLNNSIEYFNNHCFIGTTLWSKITDPIHVINDVHEIPNFDYITYNNLNKISVAFLENALFTNENCIVITHHVPSYSLIHDKYKTLDMQAYNQWFYCDMDKCIEIYNNKIKCWIYGHTHTPSNVVMNQTPFLCNPIGYPNENTNLNFQTTVKITD